MRGTVVRDGTGPVEESEAESESSSSEVERCGCDRQQQEFYVFLMAQ